jgi:hypothetical protein
MGGPVHHWPGVVDILQCSIDIAMQHHDFVIEEFECWRGGETGVSVEGAGVSFLHPWVEYFLSQRDSTMIN